MWPASPRHRAAAAGGSRDSQETVPLARAEDSNAPPGFAAAAAAAEEPPHDALHDAPVDWLATGACFAFPAVRRMRCVLVFTVTGSGVSEGEGGGAATLYINRGALRCTLASVSQLQPLFRT